MNRFFAALFAALSILLLTSLTGTRSQATDWDPPVTPEFVDFCEARPALCAAFPLKDFFYYNAADFEMNGFDNNCADFFQTFSDETLGLFFHRLFKATHHDSSRIQLVVRWMTNTWMAVYYGPAEKVRRAISIRDLVETLSDLDDAEWETLEYFAGKQDDAFAHVSGQFANHPTEVVPLIKWITVMRKHPDFMPFWQDLFASELDSLLPAALNGTFDAHTAALSREYLTRKDELKISWSFKELFNQGYWQVADVAAGHSMIYGRQDEDHGKKIRVIFKPKLGRLMLLSGILTATEHLSLTITTRDGTDHTINSNTGDLLSVFVQNSVTRPPQATLQDFRKNTIERYEENRPFPRGPQCDWNLVDALPPL